jgi:hypothetical protein
MGRNREAAHFPYPLRLINFDILGQNRYAHLRVFVQEMQEKNEFLGYVSRLVSTGMQILQRRRTRAAFLALRHSQV